MKCYTGSGQGISPNLSRGYSGMDPALLGWEAHVCVRWCPGKGSSVRKWNAEWFCPYSTHSGSSCGSCPIGLSGLGPPIQGLRPSPWCMGLGVRPNLNSSMTMCIRGQVANPTVRSQTQPALWDSNSFSQERGFCGSKWEHPTKPGTVGESSKGLSSPITWPKAASARCFRGRLKKPLGGQLWSNLLVQ